MKVWAACGTSIDGDVVIGVGLTEETAKEAYEANLKKTYNEEEKPDGINYEEWTGDWEYHGTQCHEINE